MDYYEERKWKKAYGYIIAQNAKIFNEKKEKKIKMNNIYKKIFSLYITINQNYNVSELLEYNTNDRLNDYLFDNIISDNFEELVKDLFFWKKEIKNILNEIKTNKITIFNNQKFNNIFNFIQIFINIKEEKVKEIYKKINNINFLQYNKLNNININDLADLLTKSDNKNINENHNCYIIGNESDINYDEINCKISQTINQYDEELNEDMIKIETININNAKNINNNFLISHSFKYNNLYDNSPNKISLNNKSNTEKFEEELNSDFDPSNLIMDISDGITFKNIVDYFKNNTDYGNCFSIPLFDFRKSMNNKYNYNIYINEKILEYKKIINGYELHNTSININNNIQKKILYYEKTNRNNLTPLQKLVALYGVFTTGNNPFLINFILNSYYLTSSSMYNIDEINNITKNILNEIGIKYETNYVNIKNGIFNFNPKNNHYLGSSHIIELEPFCHIYNNNKFKFKYNDIIEKIINLKKLNVNQNNEYYKNFKNHRKKIGFFSKNNKFNIKNKNVSIQKSIFLINMIRYNPFIIDIRLKKNFLKHLLQYLKELCILIKEIKNNNKSIYNYFTGNVIKDNQRQINDIKYKEIKKNKNKHLQNKNNVLKALKQHKKEFKTYSIKKYMEEINKKNNNNIKIKFNDDHKKINITDRVNKYSEYNINKAWIKMKDNWNKDNYRLNPIFKFYYDYTNDYRHLTSNNRYFDNNDCNINSNIINKCDESGENNIEFGPILNLNINQ